MKCPRCGKEKSPELMTKNRSKKSGFDAYCKQCNSDISKKWKIEHPDIALRMRRSWFARNRDSINSRRRKYLKQYHMKLREQSIEMLGSRCSNCGITDVRVLEIDHVSGGGGIERKIVGPRKMLLKIANGDTDGYQLLCGNCHIIKHLE